MLRLLMYEVPKEQIKPLFQFTLQGKGLELHEN